MIDTARLIIWFDCKRKCTYCVNKYKEILRDGIKTNDLAILKNYQYICITGGEPLLYPEKLMKIIWELRENNKNQIIFLYSSVYHEALEQIVPIINGMHYTIHDKRLSNDINDFYKFQELVLKYYQEKSFRLYIMPSIKEKICFYPYIWKRCEIKPWLPESRCKLPQNEKLYIYKK